MVPAKVFLAAVVGGLIVIGANAAIGGDPGSTTVAGSPTRVKLVRNTSGLLGTTSQDWIDPQGATTTIRVPPGQEAAILARFTAESSCRRLPGGTLQYCRVRVLIDGVEAEPSTSEDFAFDTAMNEQFEYESLSVERSLGGLAPGVHRVKVQASVSGPDTLFTLDDWHLTVERLRA
ncbi:MAG: hypothetical protein WD739_10790 [Actinomycetota bacterium]